MHHEILPVRGDSLEERLRRRPEVAVQQDLARRVENTEVHGAGVEIDAAVVLVLLGAEPHGASWVKVTFDMGLPPFGKLRRRPS